ncbi:MAG: hypothetical protein JNM88_05045 [Chitinophagaceae bacterium]|nr:hypothetical protein [Chitinophagaceae bacterium]
MKPFSFAMIVCMLLPGILAAQNVGIGTASPVMKLHISSATDTTLLLAENSNPLANNTSTGIYFRNGGYFTGAVKTTGTGSAFARLGLYTYATGGENGLIERVSITDDGNVGIGTIIPAAKLEVNGYVRITGGIPGEGKVFTCSDPVGTGSWQLPVGSGTGFKAIVGSGGFNVASSSNTSLIFTTEEYDDPSAFFSTVFSAPATGLYHFDVMVNWNITNVAVPSQYYVAIQVDGVDRHASIMQLPPNSGSGTRTQAFSVDLKLIPGQSVSVNVNQNSGLIQAILGNSLANRYSFFSGRRVY